MTEKLRIAIAEDEPTLLKDLEEMVVELGHHVVATATNGRDLVDQCRVVHPDLVVTDIKMPDMDGLEAAQEICRIESFPVVLVSAYSDAALIERALQDHVLSYLIKPITVDQLKAAIALAIRRFREFRALRQEANGLRQTLEDRKIIERAKGILMKKANLAEEDAFKRLQDLASTKNIKMIEVAKMILTMRDALEPKVQ